MKKEQTQSRGKVLVVDDEPDIVEYFTTLLEENGFETEYANDADSGARKALLFSPDLICVDIMMPKKTGLALFKALKREPRLRGIPVLFVSAFSASGDFSAEQIRAIIHGEGMPQPDGYVEKPIDRTRFVETVAGTIRGRVAPI